MIDTCDKSPLSCRRVGISQHFLAACRKRISHRREISELGCAEHGCKWLGHRAHVVGIDDST